MKHIDVKMYFIRDMAEKREICVKKTDTMENHVDYFTKALPTTKFELCLSLIILQ